MTYLRVVGRQVCLNTPVISLTAADFGGKRIILEQFRPFEHRCGHEVDGENEVVSAKTLLMLYELLQLIATGITLEKKRGDDWYEAPGCRIRFGEPFLLLLTEFDAVDVLENVESSIAGHDLNAKFQQAPQ